MNGGASDSDGDWVADYHRAVSAGGVVRLDDWSTLAITGADRVTFLQNMCTNDVRALAVGESCEAFLTDVKGKIVGHAVVFAEDEALLLVGMAGQASRLASHLDRYIIREDVQLADATERCRWSIWLGDATNAASDRVGRSFGPWRQLWASGVWARSETLAERVGPSANARLGPSGAVGEKVWHALRIESGWPLFGVDFDGSHLPQEVSRDAQAISFRKGCYLGQETVARIDALGHVNKQLATVTAEGALNAADELSAGGQPVGRVASATYSPGRGAWLGIAMLRRGHHAPGTRLTCGETSVEVVPAPAVVR